MCVCVCLCLCVSVSVCVCVSVCLFTCERHALVLADDVFVRRCCCCDSIAWLFLWPAGGHKAVLSPCSRVCTRHVRIPSRCSVLTRQRSPSHVCWYPCVRVACVYVYVIVVRVHVCCCCCCCCCLIRPVRCTCRGTALRKAIERTQRYMGELQRELSPPALQQQQQQQQLPGSGTGTAVWAPIVGGSSATVRTTAAEEMAQAAGIAGATQVEGGGKRLREGGGVVLMQV